MPREDNRTASGSRLARRSFLAALPMAFPLPVNALPLVGEDPLHVLKQDNIERLRLDFNASRSKVRLLFLLSPT